MPRTFIYSPDRYFSFLTAVSLAITEQRTADQGLYMLADTRAGTSGNRNNNNLLINEIVICGRGLI